MHDRRQYFGCGRFRRVLQIVNDRLDRVDLVESSRLVEAQPGEVALQGAGADHPAVCGQHRDDVGCRASGFLPRNPDHVTRRCELSPATTGDFKMAVDTRGGRLKPENCE